MKARVSVHVLPWILLLGVIVGMVGYKAVDAQTSDTARFELKCRDFGLSGSISTGVGGFSFKDEPVTTADLQNVSIQSSMNNFDMVSMNCSITEAP